MSVSIDKSIVVESIKDLVVESGYILIDVEVKKSADKIILGVIIDKKGGVNIEDCEKITKIIDPILDKTKNIEGKYDYLTVSSVGIDRPFLDTNEFQLHIGKKIEVKLYSTVNGTKFIQLPLLDVNEKYIILEDIKNQIKIKRSNIIKANIAIEF